MFICNLKINGKKTFKIVFIILLILVLIMCGIGIYRIFNKKENKLPDLEKTLKGQVNVISASNYTNVLKEVHSNLDTYVGMKIKFIGFVYRVYDLSNEQFVLARQMIISSDMQAVVVGFLCHLNGADKYSDGEWVEAEGTITKGDYHGEIPVIEIESIKEVNTPSDEYVYPPEQTYVPTSSRL